MAEEKKKEEQKEKKPLWTVSEIPTKTEPMVVNVEKEQAYSMELVLVEILNKLDSLTAKLDKLL